MEEEGQARQEERWCDWRRDEWRKGRLMVAALQCDRFEMRRSRRLSCMDAGSIALWKG